MGSINIFSNARRFSEITENPKALVIFLSIAGKESRTYDELVEDTTLELADVAPLVKELELGKFIEPNPRPSSNKFRLALNGQLFAEQLKSIYPEVKELLGEKSLIRPIKAGKNF